MGIHLFKGAGLDEGVNAFARADGKMMLAFGAYLGVFIEFLVEDHGGAFRALGPKALGDFFFARLGGSELGLFGESIFRRDLWRWRDLGGWRLFGRFEANSFFRKAGGGHVRVPSIPDGKRRARVSTRKRLQRRFCAGVWRRHWLWL